METILQSPSIDSFSYSWISDINPSLISSVDSLDHQDQDQSSFIEMDPRLPPSKRFFRVSSDHFVFEFPLISDNNNHNQSPLSLVHADQLISNGFLVPFYVENAVKTDGFDDDYTSNFEGKIVQHFSKSVWRRFLEKYLGFLLRPLIRKREKRRKNCEFSTGTSPRTSVAYSCDSESSIYEAVLHCKKTQGK